MTFDEIKTELQTFENTPEFEQYIAGMLTDDRLNKYLDTDSGKKYIQPKLDSHFTKSLETWKNNNLSGLVDAKVKELYPDQTPEQREIAELKAKFAESEAKALRNQLTTHAMKIATKKNLPTDLIDYFIGTDEKTTTDNLDKFEKIFNKSVESVVQKKLGESHKPDAGDDTHTLSIEDLAGMSTDEINKYFNKTLGKNK